MKILIALAACLFSAMAHAQWKEQQEAPKLKVFTATETFKPPATLELEAQKKTRLFLGVEQKSGNVTQRIGFQPKKRQLVVVQMEW